MTKELVLFPDALSALPHAYPFLLIDRVLELNDQRAVCSKLVTINEWFFEGHYPGHPVMPGMLIVEAMAQAGGVLLGKKWSGGPVVAFFSSMDGVKFRRAIRPGDAMRIEATLLQNRRNTYRFRGEVFVEEALAAEAEFTVSLIAAAAAPTA